MISAYQSDDTSLMLSPLHIAYMAPDNVCEKYSLLPILRLQIVSIGTLSGTAIVSAPLVLCSHVSACQL